jgi:hypothetical protein
MELEIIIMKPSTVGSRQADDRMKAHATARLVTMHRAPALFV